MVKLPGFADLPHFMRLAKPGTTAVDVGASVGNYAVALRKAVGPSCRVLALEANAAGVQRTGTQQLADGDRAERRRIQQQRHR